MGISTRSLEEDGNLDVRRVEEVAKWWFALPPVSVRGTEDRVQ